MNLPTKKSKEPKSQPSSKKEEKKEKKREKKEKKREKKEKKREKKEKKEGIHWDNDSLSWKKGWDEPLEGHSRRGPISEGELGGLSLAAQASYNCGLGG